jgi:pimeloyl-ACP methyl ester carboxylesterase
MPLNPTALDAAAPVRIREISTFVLEAPIAKPVRNSWRTLTSRSALLIRITDDSGAQGWGEVWCNYPPRGAHHRADLINHVAAPIISGRDFDGPQLVFNTLETALRIPSLTAGEPGPFAQIFPAVAKALFINPLVPRIFAGTVDLTGGAGRFVWRSTHSRIDAEGLACYRTLLKHPGHAGGALAMMANWDLPGLRERMGAAPNPVLLVHGGSDPAIPLAWASDAQNWLADARLDVLSGLGHLAHEEAPDKVAAKIAAFLTQHG